MSKLFVKENEVTRANGTAGCRAYIEKEYDDGDVKMVQVLVRDYDGGLGGPYRFPKEYLVDREAGQHSVHPTPLTLFGMRVEIANWLKPGQWFIRPSRRG